MTLTVPVPDQILRGYVFSGLHRKQHVVTVLSTNLSVQCSNGRLPKQNNTFVPS